jgi:hypothetical protein
MKLARRLAPTASEMSDQAGRASYWINAIDIVLKLDADIFVPGQGQANWMSDPSASRQALIRFRRFWWMRATQCREKLHEGQQKIRPWTRSNFPSTKA